ncbi:Cu/Zn superoxide dismutase-related protein [Metarhizium album ARSEF 1941]|uniref:superoxide dismutase n=1 Tax=Metarhizium album (strain ARSEF 1941) TaxID=1081103 RepID=A0A0B2WDS1_METAS|nr:Cu/Zn superoxide dismutase-related protein [Metarhizium album ARSEF 1941]KHN94026.1 Cu/Zn superoxide dismutase-related protein [Metarhizium album ARSEF 1941]
MMLSLLVAGLAALAQATRDAPVVHNNARAIYEAVLPSQPFHRGNLHGNIRGSVQASPGPDGVGVLYRVEFQNLPEEGGPFLYHIHVNPVPSDGNCTKTLAHLDPYKRGETPPCNASAPQTCQVGDLSGKYGEVKNDPFVDEYLDPYSSLDEGTEAFMGNRSIVVHFANKTRITCANLERIPGCSP